MAISSRRKTPGPGDRATPAGPLRRHVSVWVVAFSAALAMVAIAWATIAGTAPQSSTVPMTGPAFATPATSAPGTPSPTGKDAPVTATRDLTPAAAKDLIGQLLASVGDASADPVQNRELRGIAGGMILAELQNRQNELIANGWKQTGTEVVVSVSVKELNADSSPPVATVEACIDSSDVVLLDASNVPIVSGTPAAERRAVNIYTLGWTEADGWRVADRTLPDDARC